MILRYLFYGLLIYMAYRLIFNFIIPVYKTTKQVKKQFKDVQDRMQDQYNNTRQAENSRYNASPQAEPSEKKVGEYIDFEEIKES